MELNNKYEIIINKIGQITEAAPPKEKNNVLIGILLRQIIELHQKIDEIEEKLPKKSNIQLLH